MTKKEKDDLLSKLDTLYEETTSTDIQINEDILATAVELPNINNILVFDYEKEQEDFRNKSLSIVNNLAGLYLNDDERLLTNPYIKNKIENDALNLADMFFLKKMANRALISQLRTIDAGDTTPRAFEVLFNGSKEVRENIKQASTTTSQLETFYKNIRKDLGIENKPIGQDIKDDKSDNITTQKDLNERLDEILKNIKDNSYEK